MWRGEFGTTPPFDIGPDALFVAYSRMGGDDVLHDAGLALPGTRLRSCTLPTWPPATSCCRYNPDENATSRASDCPTPVAPTASTAGRTSTSRRWPRTSAKAAGANTARRPFSNYCEEDVRNSTKLLRAQLRRLRVGFSAADVPRVLHWSNYSAEARRADPGPRHADRRAAVESGAGEQGRPSIAQLLHGNSIRATAATIRSTRPMANGVTRASSVARQFGVTSWPRLESGQLDIDGDAFRLMCHVPGVEGLHALRDSLGRHRQGAKLPIGRDGRNRPSLFPFWHGNRPQCACEKPVQRARRHALVHVVPARHDRRLSRLAHTGSRHRRRRVR